MTDIDTMPLDAIEAEIEGMGYVAKIEWPEDALKRSMYLESLPEIIRMGRGVRVEFLGKVGFDREFDTELDAKREALKFLREREGK